MRPMGIISRFRLSVKMYILIKTKSLNVYYFVTISNVLLESKFAHIWQLEFGHGHH